MTPPHHQEHGSEVDVMIITLAVISWDLQLPEILQIYDFVGLHCGTLYDFQSHTFEWST